MKTINDLIYGYIIGDSYGLSILNNMKHDNSIKLKFNENLNIEKGYFSQMTSFMLATLDSIADMKEVNVANIMNKMCTTLIVGKYTNDKRVYDLDNNTLNILSYYSKKNNFNYDINENNYSAYPLSRVLPIAIYNFYNTDTLDNLIPVITLTHDNEIVDLGCFIYYKYILNLLNGKDKYKALKIKIPKYFSTNSIKYYNNLLKGNIFYKDIIFNDNIINVLNIVFYIILNSDNTKDIINMTSNLEGNTNIYASLIFSIGSILYGKENFPNNLIKDLKNKKEINKYIKNFERMFI